MMAVHHARGSVNIPIIFSALLFADLVVGALVDRLWTKGTTNVSSLVNAQNIKEMIIMFMIDNIHRHSYFL